ncbi:hypothetical protein GCM10007989_34400 [Devosia pacifica]|uniref:Chloramphenicol phosphotransferase n=1 Tax=Devosia pacifica TaxID=1335967 RepID=A0A918SF27_9HYPH|nr:chloramphenicol phosphotransferase [Devosia pacifica]GHA35554.1 hypothetical protein GCM10007989_34400 [Devosia pacifica]
MAKVILLNGVGSAGKSSVAKALQTIAAGPVLHIQMDTFLEMLPDRYANHPDTFAYEQIERDGLSEVVISSGPRGAQILRGMRRSVKAMAAEGFDVVVDDVLFGRDDPAFADYEMLLVGHDLHWVGVLADLETLEMRERLRGDRLIGLARWQFERVHHGMNYDLELRSDEASPLELAEQIRYRFSL